jgi:hypothetical protein
LRIRIRNTDKYLGKNVEESLLRGLLLKSTGTESARLDLDPDCVKLLFHIVGILIPDSTLVDKLCEVFIVMSRVIKTYMCSIFRTAIGIKLG